MASPTAPPVGTYGVTTASSCPTPPSKTGSRLPGKKNLHSLSTTYRDEALAGFSGYLAIDEVYDGPFCVLSIVDNRAFRRLAFRVLEHDPDQEDLRSLLADFQAELDRRSLVVHGITTDGSSLYPKVLKELWPKTPHQICVFHVLKEITKGVLRALAKLRKELAKQIPKLPRGRPRQDKQSRARARLGQAPPGKAGGTV